MEKLISSKFPLLSARHGRHSRSPFVRLKPLQSCSLFSKRDDNSPLLSVSSCSSSSLNPLIKCDSSDPGSEKWPEKKSSSAQLDFSSSSSSSAKFILKLVSLTALSLVLALTAHPVHASSISSLGTGKLLLNSEILSSAWTGFMAGCLHTLSGPDHLVALAPLSIGRTRTESALVGALWGFGHDAGQVIFGLIFLLLKDRLHLDFISKFGSIIVGLTLLTIGVLGIKESSNPPPLPQFPDQKDQTVIPQKKKVGFATFFTGIVHGLQADALMMVLPAVAMPSRVAGASFLGMFLVGTVFAMSGYTVFICSCSEVLKERVPKITEKLTWAASFLAVLVGLGIVLGQFLGFSLFG
ncbi:hypothetical protein LUZ60_015038 [Juncus effusus]|nr:hypothetical protein LUZ60_015038 [Juncus effusus]